MVRDLIDCVRDGGDVSFKVAIESGGKYGIEGEKIFLFSDLLFRL